MHCSHLSSTVTFEMQLNADIRALYLRAYMHEGGLSVSAGRWNNARGGAKRFGGQMECTSIVSSCKPETVLLFYYACDN